ncbi:MAG: HEAT repeat domain-containing protein [Caldilineaceae bacterium]
MIATEPNQAPRAARAIIRIQQHHDLDWSLLRDCAFIGDDDNCTEAILALFDGSQHEIALPATLNLLALYPANTVSRREVRLWPVVEALLTYGFTEIGVAAARWLALRPGYSYRLQAIDALLQAGRVEDATPLYQYLAYECHDETSHEAARKLLLLKELERITPLLAGSVQSDVPESKYQACLGLALATHLAGDYHDLAKPRWELKVSILEERTAALESALEHFYTVSLKLLEQIARHSEHRHFTSIARIALDLLPARLMRNLNGTFVLDLLEDEVYPVIRLNAARFMLCLGDLDVAYKHLTDLCQMPENVTLPVYCKALELVARIAKPETIEIMLQALDSAKEEVRRIAARALGLIGNSQAVKPLLSLLTDKDQNTRCSAVRSLGLLGDSQAIPTIIETLMNDKNEFARSAAASALGQLGDSQTIKALLHAYNDSHNWVRHAVMEALGDLKLANCIPILMHGLNDKNSNVRRQAIFELGHFEPAQLQEYKVIPHLLGMLKHDEEPIARFHAAQSLGLIGDFTVVQPLLNRLDEKDGFALGGILWALNRFYATNGVKHFAKSVIESVETTPPLAANLLLHLLGDTTFTTKIKEAICSDSSDTRTAVGFILGSSEDVELLHVLLASLPDEDSGIRYRVVYALGNYRIPILQRYLLHLLHEEYAHISASVATALARTDDRLLYQILLTTWWANTQLDHADLLDTIAALKLTEATSFCEAIAVANTPYDGERVARALIHLRSTAAFTTIDRFERQFRHISDFKMLRGQAHWVIGRSDLAIDCFHQALQQEETMSNYLAIVHYYIEHRQIILAQEYLNRAFDKVRNYREDCLLTQAVLYWLTNEPEASMATFGNTHPRSRTKHYIDELEFNDFWRATALTALREIHDRYTTRETEIRP